MDAVMKIAKKHGLRVIEDCAEAHGAEVRGRKVGTYDIGCFSFYSNKIITTGEGGMIITDDDELADRADLLRNLAFSRERRFLHNHVGFNYRMNNVSAAIGVAQLKKMDRFIKRKREIARQYNELLSGVPGITTPPGKGWAKSVYWMYCILVDKGFGMTRDGLMGEMKRKGIETRTFFIPMNSQPAFHEIGLFRGQSCPVAEGLSEQGMYLPSGTGLTDEQITGIADVLKGASKG
jgi:perosamine synthetase